MIAKLICSNAFVPKQFITALLMRKLLLVVCCLGILAGYNETPAQRRNSRRTPDRRPAKSEPAPAMPVLPDIRSDPDVQAADVAIIANITAKELRFDVVPNPTVEFLDKPKTQTIWHAERFNLPEKIEPGVTYRNIGIQLKITSRLADIDRIVAEALGEISATQPENSTPNRSENVGGNQNALASAAVSLRSNKQRATAQKNRSRR